MWIFYKRKESTSWLLIDLLKGDELEPSGPISTARVSRSSALKQEHALPKVRDFHAQLKAELPHAETLAWDHGGLDPQLAETLAWDHGGLDPQLPRALHVHTPC